MGFWSQKKIQAGNKMNFGAEELSGIFWLLVIFLT